MLLFFDSVGWETQIPKDYQSSVDRIAMGVIAADVFSTRQHATACYRKSVCLSVHHMGGSVENG